MARRLGLVILALVLVLAGCAAAGGSPASPTDAPSAATPTAPTAPTAPTGPTGPTAPPGMPVVSLADLPPEAAETLARIAAGGPFPYRQDGASFENREGLLPDAPLGTYREYTVPTPGEDGRGARRIVTGPDGARYWTADHYASFAWIDR